MNQRKIAVIQKPLLASKKSVIHTGDGLTEQCHKNECDMNYILKDYARTGFIAHSKQNEGKYDDISSQDFQEAMFIVAEANNMFNSLPAALRQRFSNNPSVFMDFVQNPDNKAELLKMGVLRGNDGLDINGAITNAPLPDKQEAKPTIPKGDDKQAATPPNDQRSEG